ncbi:MAG: hypothetical protein NTV88_02280 [Candidatus Micrarchaeota archaeon]|nr:hypothetical protein [Candidatus Micrarchaeota archaeon]
MVATTKILTIATALLFLAGIAFAGCSENAYRNACASCPFDANGKIDKDCMSGQKSAGIGCVSASYPFMAAEYAQGKCPQVDVCASQLSQCLSQMGTGNDKADCQEGSATTCYAISDQCVQSASGKCPPPVPSPCGAPPALIMLVIGAVFLAGFVRKQ